MDLLFPSCLRISLAFCVLIGFVKITLGQSTSKTCGKHMFDCKTWPIQCIDDLLTCDGNADCNNAADETKGLCGNNSCLTYGFRCDYGGCIDDIKKCNGINDCYDASDEAAHLCNTELSQPEAVKVTFSTSNAESRPEPQPASEALPELGVLGCRIPASDVFHLETFNCDTETDGSCIYTEGDSVSFSTAVKIVCRAGFYSDEEYTFCQEDGSWSPRVFCQERCPIIVIPTVVAKCTYKGQETRCDEDARPGTKATLECIPKYVANDPTRPKVEIECVNGDWSEAIRYFSCTKLCGRTNNFIPLLTNGTKVAPHTYPWVAGLYTRKSGALVFKCHGIVISEIFVITDARCVCRKFKGPHGEEFFNKNEPQGMMVAVGKISRQWNTHGGHEQTISVKAIEIPDAFQGKQNGFEGSIALLYLSSKIHISNIVHPACLPSPDTSIDFWKVSKGVIQSWGKTAIGGKYSEDLLEGEFSIKSQTQCEEVKRIFKQKYNFEFSSDKFCAQDINSKLIGGDTGLGITAAHPNNYRHYLLGIYYAGVNDFRIFTDITKYLSWIEEKRKILIGS